MIHLPPREKWMRLALELAEKGRFSTSPNPMVGAVLVRENKQIAQGCHQKYGGPHAEIIALRRAGRKARGSTLYVTLEPCASWGKTPPCVTAILESGIREVFIGALDPNPKNHGKGIRALKNAGVKVAGGILASEVQKQNEAFFKYVRTGLPFVTLKMAQSLDGKIATRTGLSRWISSEAARDFVHRLRAEQDAILVGTQTLLKDNPLLSPRVNPNGLIQKGKPWRVVLDARLRISPTARIFRGEQITVIAISEKIVKGLPAKTKKWNGRVTLLPVAEHQGHLDLKDLLTRLGALGIAKLLVEGGGETAWSFLEAGLVDKFYWIVAPKFFGGTQAKTSVEGPGVRIPSQAIRPSSLKCTPLGEDWLFEGNF